MLKVAVHVNDNKHEKYRFAANIGKQLDMRGYSIHWASNDYLYTNKIYLDYL